MDKLDNILKSTASDIDEISNTATSITNNSNSLYTKISEIPNFSHSIKTHELIASCSEYMLKSMKNVILPANIATTEAVNFENFIKHTEKYKDKIECECQVLSTLNEILRNNY